MHQLSPCPTHITHFPIHSSLKGGNNNAENDSTAGDNRCQLSLNKTSSGIDSFCHNLQTNGDNQLTNDECSFYRGVYTNIIIVHMKNGNLI